MSTKDAIVAELNDLAAELADIANSGAHDEVYAWGLHGAVALIRARIERVQKRTVVRGKAKS